MYSFLYLFLLFFIYSIIGYIIEIINCSLIEKNAEKISPWGKISDMIRTRMILTFHISCMTILNWFEFLYMYHPWT